VLPHSPERATDRRREKAVDERIGRRVEGGQRLDESGHRDVGLRAGHLAKHLQQVEHHVRAPTQDEHYEEMQADWVFITWI